MVEPDDGDGSFQMWMAENIQAYTAAFERSEETKRQDKK